MKKINFSVFCVAFILLDCSNPKELSIDQYMLWLGKERNGLVKNKTVNHVNLRMSYLPPELLAFREWKGYQGRVSYDSILNYYKCGMVFQFILQADKDDRKYASLMYYGLSSQDAVKERIEFLNFNINSILFLEYGKEKLSPVLSHFEGFDQIRNQAAFQVSFIIPDFNCGKMNSGVKNIRLIFEDPVWDLGTNNFEFEGEKFVGIPTLQIATR